jgi:hypothetical protein
LPNKSEQCSQQASNSRGDIIFKPLKINAGGVGLLVWPLDFKASSRNETPRQTSNLPRGFTLSRWLAGDGLGSGTAPRGHSWALRQGLTIAAVGVSGVSQIPVLAPASRDRSSLHNLLSVSPIVQALLHPPPLTASVMPPLLSYPHAGQTNRLSLPAVLGWPRPWRSWQPHDGWTGLRSTPASCMRRISGTIPGLNIFALPPGIEGGAAW